MLLLISLPLWAFDWQGHRGARGLYPENSTGAMLEALKYPQVTTLELDVVISKDGEVVVSHEPWMGAEICLDLAGKPVAERAINLYKLNYVEIAQYDCGSKVHPRFPEQQKIKTSKPLLRDLIVESEKKIKELGRAINYNIEIKSTVEDEREGFQPSVAVFTDKVVEVIAQTVGEKRATIQSFDWRVLKYLHKTYPRYQTVALIEEKYVPTKVLKELGFKPTVFSPYFVNLTREHVAFFRRNDIKVIPWTVNEVEDMKRVMRLGVDGIITDYPNRIKEIQP
jgi:glycerophosphoryl diester phosphodiesterase